MVEVDKAQFALCTLQPGKIPQQPLDYCFTEGEEITFFTEGPGDVHLTGLFCFYVGCCAVICIYLFIYLLFL